MQKTSKKILEEDNNTNKQNGIFKKLEDKQRYLIYASIAIALVIIAVLSIVLSSNAESLSSCATKVLPRAKLSCYVYYANTMHNESVCGQLNGLQRDICMNDYSYNYSSATACTDINSLQYKESCILGISLQTKNVTACGLLNQSGQDNCIYAIAKDENFSNLGLCDIIKNTSIKQSCDTLYYYINAMTYENFSSCLNLPDILDNTTLYTIASSDYNPFQSGAFYEAMYSNITPQDYCYIGVAYKTDNRSLCNNLNGSTRALCNSTTKNKELGNNISTNLTNHINMTLGYGNNASESAALRNITGASISIYNALTERNISACLKINQSAYVYTCVVDLAKQYNQSSYCSYLENSTLSYNCYLAFNNTT